MRGTVPPGRYIVVSNHQSTADIAILPWALRRLNVKFVAKEELGRGSRRCRWRSALGFGADFARGTRDDIARIKVMARGLAHWEASVVIFPEGTRSRDGRLLPDKPGAVRIVATDAALPLLPVAIDGTHVAPDLAGFARACRGARGTVTIGGPYRLRPGQDASKTCRRGDQGLGPRQRLNGAGVMAVCAPARLERMASRILTRRPG